MLKKLFTNDKVFLVSVILGVIGIIMYTIYYCIPGVEDFDFMTAFIFTLMGVCLIFLYISYSNHSKNVMKGLIAVLLTCIWAASTYWFDSDFIQDRIMSYVLFTLKGIFFINHFIINKEHHSKPVNVRVNQIVALLIGAIEVVWDFMWIICYPIGIVTFGAVADCIGSIGVTASIVCVESRLDAYRLNRESAGWTEEKGYPEGYVHEYQKNK